MMKDMRPHLFSFDFDDTLAHFCGDLEGLFGIFERAGVPRKIVRAAYQNLRNSGGFSITRFVAVLHGAGFTPTATTGEAEAKRWLATSLELYPDAARLIGTPLKIPSAIVTFGDPDYQRQKISIVGLDQLPTFIVSEPFSKAKPLRQLIADYGAPIAHVDDVGSELDAIRHAGLTETEVITYHIVRSSSPEPHTEFPHKQISSLNQIFGD